MTQHFEPGHAEQVDAMRKRYEKGLDLWDGKPLTSRNKTPHAEFDAQPKGVSHEEYARREKQRKKAYAREKKKREMRKKRAAKPPAAHPDIIGPTGGDA